LVRVVDAHFGRILNLKSVAMQGQNLLISSSIDRSVKIWNMENIFEKSFAVINMDQPIEKILLAKERPALAVTQTRKYIGVWDIRSHRFITTLVTNIYGSVVTDCLISSNGRTVICIESDTLLLWDLKTQSVRLRHPAISVHQIIWPRLIKNQKKDVIVHRLIPMPHNANQLVVMDGENRGSIWDVRHLKLIRSLPTFGGDITEDGKLGLHAPNK
uniref:Uncharacterized protein n=1 Tax=Panagrolaimus sp. PS1159 TaxID=55785 RepID=A0AC35GW83_9BILA